jgi:hypothetical protein
MMLRSYEAKNQASTVGCWKHLTPEAYRVRVAELIHQIEATAAAKRAKKGVEPLGSEKILAQDPETRREPARLRGGKA